MKFYEMAPERRRARMRAEGSLSPQDAELLARSGRLDPAVADGLIENQIGQFALPLGVARGLVVNGEPRDVPMVTEESSVVAAASNGARIAALNGGVAAHAPVEHRVRAEVVFADVPDRDAALAILSSRRRDVFDVARRAKPSIVARGGGLRDVSVEPVRGEFLKIALDIDVQAAMGANIADTIAEAVAAAAGEWIGVRALTAILTNAVPGGQAVTAEIVLDPATVACRGIAGDEVAEGVARLSRLAEADVERAVTHNKGIMNGISAAVLATGNDTRAVEAGAHAFAARTGRYRPLAVWSMEEGRLVGRIAVPLQVGVVGGATTSLPAAGAAQRIARYLPDNGSTPSVAAYQETLAALGLVQNLAALRALAGPGIQAGHMALQASNLAISAGARGGEITAVAAALQSRSKDLETAKSVLGALRSDP